MSPGRANALAAGRRSGFLMFLARRFFLGYSCVRLPPQTWARQKWGALSCSALPKLLLPLLVVVVSSVFWQAVPLGLFLCSFVSLNLNQAKGWNTVLLRKAEIASNKALRFNIVFSWEFR